MNSTDPSRRACAPLGLERPLLFGQIARRIGGVPSDQLERCLLEQQQTGKRLGSVLRDRGLLDQQQLLRVLRWQARWVAATVRADRGSERLPVSTFLSVCFPAYNEQDNIEDTLDAACAFLPNFVRRFEIIVVDDGSTDRTASVVESYARREPRVRLLRHPHNLGYGAAVSSGLRFARGELVGFTDSDGQFSLLDLPQFLTSIEDNDVVVGYRYVRADRWPRLVNAWCWNQLIRLLLGVQVRDLDCAFKLFRRSVIDRLHLTASGACISAEIMTQCVQQRYRIREVPVCHFPRHCGSPSGAQPGVILRAFRELPQLLHHRRLAGRGVSAAPERSARRDPALELEPRGPLGVCMLAACPFPANHGTPGSIREMSEALAQQGHAVHIVTYHIGERIPLRGPVVHRVPQLTRESAVVVGPTVRRPLYDLQMIFKALEVIRRHRIHVIHAHGYEAALVAGVCRQLTGLPVLYSGHNTMSDELPTYGVIRPEWVARALARCLDAFVPDIGDRCCPHSTNMERFFHRGRWAARTEPLVNFGIDVTWMAAGDAAGVRQRYGLGDDPVVVYTGVLDRFQRLDLLLHAMVSVCKREPRTRLVVVQTIARPDHAAAFSRQTAELGLADRLVLTEPQPLESVRDILAAANVGVVPRPGAPGFPIKLLNYWASRTPCALFATSASAGLLHRENVMLAAPDTAEALSNAVVDLLRDPDLRARVAEGGFAFVKAHHDRAGMAAQIAAAYRRMLVPAGRPRPVAPHRIASSCATPPWVADRDGKDNRNRNGNGNGNVNRSAHPGHGSSNGNGRVEGERRPLGVGGRRHDHDGEEVAVACVRDGE